MQRGRSTWDELAGEGAEVAREGSRAGPSMQRRRLGPRRATPSSLDGVAKRMVVRFSLERGEGDGASTRE